jgi:hypothetical protein
LSISALRRVTLLANQVALGAGGIPLDQNSIALDLESSDPGALRATIFCRPAADAAVVCSGSCG